MSTKHENAKIEGWVLGALMDAENVGQPLSAIVGAIGLADDDFTNGLLKAAFGAVSVLADRGRPADPETIWSVLGAGRDGFTQGLQKLAQLKAANTAFSIPAIQAHADELKRLSRLRTLDAFCRKQLEQLSGTRPDPIRLGAELAEFTSTFTASTEGDSTGAQDVIELSEEWGAFISGKREPHLATGIRVLDDEICGFVPNLNVVGGLPSVGKSALTAEILANCLGRGMRLGLFGLEDATKWVAKRLASRMAGIPLSRFGATRLNEFQQACLQEALGKTSALLRNLVTYKQAGIDSASLIQRCKHWVINRGVQAIFIDHGGEVQHRRHGEDDFRLAVTDTYRQLRDFAVNHRVPIVVLCHFNRDTEKSQNGEPRMSNFAEAAGIERMARLALGLWEHKGELRCTVLKRTEGRRGVTLWLERDTEHALVKSDGGGIVAQEDKTQTTMKQRLWNEVGA